MQLTLGGGRTRGRRSGSAPPGRSPRHVTAVHDGPHLGRRSARTARAKRRRKRERRGTARVPKDTKVEILAVYCSQCRRPYDAVSDKPCVAAVNRDHLIGGPTGERRKRKDGPTQVAAGMYVEVPAATLTGWTPYVQRVSTDPRTYARDPGSTPAGPRGEIVAALLLVAGCCGLIAAGFMVSSAAGVAAVSVIVLAAGVFLGLDLGGPPYAVSARRFRRNCSGGAVPVEAESGQRRVLPVLQRPGHILGPTTAGPGTGPSNGPSLRGTTGSSGCSSRSTRSRADSARLPFGL